MARRLLAHRSYLRVIANYEIDEEVSIDKGDFF